MTSETIITKPVLPPLQTPKSASFPSEIVSTPMSAHPLSAFIKQEQDMKTPITPPSAYLDFLKALTPNLASPPPSGLGRSMSDDVVITNRESSKNGWGAERHLSPTSIPTPHSAPVGSGRGTPTSLKRLRIPSYSPAFSPTSGTRSPHTAMTMSSALYSPFSPADWTGRASFDSIATPRSACTKPVSVRSVVTRTVTYKRTNLEPAPKGKRRKIGSSASSVTSKEATPEPSRPRLDRIEEAPRENVEVQLDVKPAEIKSVPESMPPPTGPTINVSPASSVTGSETDGSDISSSGSSTASASP